MVGTSSPAAATEPTGTAGGTEGAVGAEGAAGGSVANRARTRRGNPVSTPPVAGVHLQFGADAAIEIVVSWHSLQPVSWPRVLLGSAAGRFQRVVDARTVSYTDAKSGQIVYAHHASVKGLHPATEYLYAVGHDGAEAHFATFVTAPRGRASFTFTSFGGQGTPTTGKVYTPPAGVTIAEYVW